MLSAFYFFLDYSIMRETHINNFYFLIYQRAFVDNPSTLCQSIWKVMRFWLKYELATTKPHPPTLEHFRLLSSMLSPISNFPSLPQDTDGRMQLMIIWDTTWKSHTASQLASMLFNWRSVICRFQSLIRNVGAVSRNKNFVRVLINEEINLLVFRETRDSGFSSKHSRPLAFGIRALGMGHHDLTRPDQASFLAQWSYITPTLYKEWKVRDSVESTLHGKTSKEKRGILNTAVVDIHTHFFEKDRRGRSNR